MESQNTTNPTPVNGAQALIQTLVDCGVDTCFTNPGTSEMHFVAALDSVPKMRGILALFEGVAAGAADGFGRMADRPASTLLHLGPGLGNAIANLHNARRAHTPIMNIVGDHASYHKRLDAPLESDIDALASNVSKFIRVSARPQDVGADAADAYLEAMTRPSGVATLVLPADVSWQEGGKTAPKPTVAAGAMVSATEIDSAAKTLFGSESVAMLLGDRAMRKEALILASKIANKCGVKLLAETFPSRHQRGAGMPPIDRLGYLAEFAQMQLDGIKNLILVGAREPVSFFAYPNKASELTPEGCQLTRLGNVGHDLTAVLRALCEAVGALDTDPTLAQLSRPSAPTGSLDAAAVANSLGALMPEGAIIADEGNTSGLWAAGATAGCPPHDWLCLTGGAIGYGMPVATGAAVACSDRKVINLQADGSAMYTLQSLWTQAREGLDVVTIIFNNRSYAVLNMELARVGATNIGETARSMLDLSNPDLDFVSLAKGMGVPAQRALDADSFHKLLAQAIAEPGPSLIEAVVPSI